MKLATFAADGLPGKVTLTALTFPKSLTYEEWVRAGRLLGRMGHGIQWWLGDWLLFGEGHYGEKFAQAIEDTQLAEQTLLNLVSVARAVAPTRRREQLSFSHHAAVSGLEADDQEHYLNLAAHGDNLPNGEQKPWSVSRLRQEVRGAVAGKKDKGKVVPLPDAIFLDVGQHILLDKWGRCRVTRIAEKESEQGYLWLQFERVGHEST